MTRILDGGAADKSKQIFPGDIIQSVDGVVTHGWSLAKVPCVSPASVLTMLTDMHRGGSSCTQRFRSWKL